MKHDPERDLWLPSRRSFFFLGASAAVGAILPPATIKIYKALQPGPTILSLSPFLPELDPRLIWIEAPTPPFITTAQSIERELAATIRAFDLDR